MTQDPESIGLLLHGRGATSKDPGGVEVGGFRPDCPPNLDQALIKDKLILTVEGHEEHHVREEVTNKRQIHSLNENRWEQTPTFLSLFGSLGSLNPNRNWLCSFGVGTCQVHDASKKELITKIKVPS